MLQRLLLLLPLAACQQYESMLLGALQTSYLVSSSAQADCQLPTPMKFRWAPYEAYFADFLTDMMYYSHLCAFEEAEATIEEMLGDQVMFDLTYQNLLRVVDVETILTEIYTQLEVDGLAYEAGVKVGQMVRTLMMLNSPYIMHFKSPHGKLDPKLRQISDGTPLAIFHGIGDCCCFPGMGNFTAHMAAELGVYVRCVEIGSGPTTSWFTSMSDQVQMACNSLKSDPHFQSGLNVLGLSQGGLIARAMVETCGVNVRKLVTMGGPHMGVASFPQCEHGFQCALLRDMLDTGAYFSYFQHHIAPAGYFKDPYKYNDYVKNCEFLPILNNEQSTQNSAYAASMESLDLLQLIKFTKDTVVDPQESEWFGFYAENSMSTVLAWNETEAYQGNWLGLKTLVEAGKVQWVEIPAQHLQMTMDQVNQYIVTALQD